MNEIEETTKYTTVDKDTWAMMIAEARKTIEFITGAYYDLHGVDYLAPLVDGYMTGPVAVYNGKPIEARSVMIDDIGDALELMMNNGDRIIMYMLIFMPSMPVYSKLDDATFTNIPLDKPYVTTGKWKLRYALLPA